VIPTMRKHDSGTIVNLSSIGGRIGISPFNTAYHASKFAVEGFTESLRLELSEFNINVILIEPGFIRSNFMDNIKTAKDFDSNKSPYAKTVQQLFQGFEPMIANSSHPKDVALVILNAVNSANPNVRYPVGRDAESVLKARAELPDKELEQWVREGYMERKGFIRQ
jgi:NAD(P)-dependent dehydrogenase (short-subunit alcohol dehydrogenase family)